MNHPKPIIYQDLCSTQDFILRGSFNQSYTYLKLIANQNSQHKKCYQILIPSDSSDSTYIGIQKLFDKIQYFKQYLKSPENSRVNYEESSLTILGKHPIKKSEFVELFTLKLEEKEISPTMVLEDIVAMTNNKQDISQQDIKFILKQLTQNLIRLVSENNVGEEINGIVNKITHVGNQIQVFKAKIADIFDQNEQNKENYKKVQKHLQNHNEKFQTQLKILRADIQAYIHKNIEIENNLNDFKTDSEHRLMKLYVSLESQTETIQKLRKQLDIKPQGLQQIQERPKVEERQSAQHLVDFTAKFTKHFKIKGINITKQVDFIFPTILIGAKPLIEHPFFTVKAKKMGILQNIYPGVCVGIVDSKHKNKQTCVDGDNVIEFQCSGKLYENNKFVRQEELGFVAGDIIKVKVDFDIGRVTWEINGKIRTFLQSEKVKDKSIDWRPYIFMRDKGDSVNWLQG